MIPYPLRPAKPAAVYNQLMWTLLPGGENLMALASRLSTIRRPAQGSAIARQAIPHSDLEEIFNA